MNYTKENFIKGDFAFINDGSKELEEILKEWFPKDPFKAHGSGEITKYVVYIGGQWMYDKCSKGTTIKASEINNPKEWLSSEMEIFWNGKWFPCFGHAKYRLKQFPDHTEEIQRLAKEMNVTVKIEKI